MNASVIRRQESLQFMKNAKKEAINYFAQKNHIRQAGSGSNYFSFNYHYTDGNSSFSCLSPKEQEKRDLQEAKIIGIALLFLGTLAANLIISPLQQLFSLVAEDRKHLSIATADNDPVYQIIASDSLDIHSTQASRIYKHALAAFSLIAGATILTTAGFTATPLLLSSGYTLVASSFALAFFTELYHSCDETYFDRRYADILAKTGLLS